MSVQTPGLQKEDFNFDKVRDTLEPLADTIVIEGDVHRYFEDGSVAAEVTKLQGEGYAAVLSDTDGDYTEALEELANNYEDIGFRNGQLLNYQDGPIF